MKRKKGKKQDCLRDRLKLIAAVRVFPRYRADKTLGEHDDHSQRAVLVRDEVSLTILINSVSWRGPLAYANATLGCFTVRVLIGREDAVSRSLLPSPSFVLSFVCPMERPGKIGTRGVIARGAILSKARRFKHNAPLARTIVTNDRLRIAAIAREAALSATNLHHASYLFISPAVHTHR